MNYVIKDHLGSTRVMINTTDLPYALTTYDYSAFGTILTPPPSSAYLYTGQEWDQTSGLHNFKARMYDGELGIFYANDPKGQFNSPYTYGGNNPLVMRDADGELAWFVPIIIGAAIGGGFGAYRAEKMGRPWYEGAWKGALVGAIGGAMAPVGGGTFVSNLAWGAAEGAFTGGLDAALWGQDVGKGMLWGAASGVAFATVTSGVEMYKNSKEGWGFRTDLDALNHAREGGDVATAKSILEKRYGLDASKWTVVPDKHPAILRAEANLQSSLKARGLPVTGNETVNATTEFSKFGDLLNGGSLIKKSAFMDTRLSLQSTVAHELEHQLTGPIPEVSLQHANVYRSILDRAGQLHLNWQTFQSGRYYFNQYSNSTYWQYWNYLPRRF
jgi:RHS repeat-associated protein